MKSDLMSGGMTETEACNKVRSTYNLFSPDYSDYLTYTDKTEYPTHFNKNGAKLVAEIISELIQTSDSSLKNFVKN